MVRDIDHGLAADGVDVMDSSEPTVTRRKLLRFGGAASFVIMTSSGCSLLSTDPDTEGREGAGPRQTSGDPGAKEAPSLADQVKAGKLPPLAQRMPKSPLVVQPIEKVGTYGGTWQTCVGNPDASFLYMNLGYDGLVRWSRDWSKVEPNLAESWDAGGDGRQYTFHLRPGVKWSDGQECTADDIVFAYNDVLRNQELFPTLPEWLTAGGRPATVEKVDSHTVRFTFVEPKGLFLQYLASSSGNVLTALPRHYFQQFHKKYAPDAEAKAKQKGHNGWADGLLAMGGAGMTDIAWWQNPAIPTIAAWKTSQPLGGGLRLAVDRNPYYWKTDPDGRQLPYIDQVRVQVIQDPQVAVLRSSQGQFSLTPDEFAAIRDKPVLAAGRDDGGYRFIDMPQSNMNSATFVFNLAHRDPKLRQVFQNKDFRIGLSYAINRQEIINTVLQRQGEPWQTSPLRQSKFFDEKLAKQYTEYDVAKANEHLDRAGYTQRDGAGFRLRPDGERLAFTVQVRLGTIPIWVDTAELVRGYWQRVGVDARVQTGNSELVIQRVEANQHDVVMDDGYPGLDDVLLDPAWYVPYQTGCQWGVPWGTWYVSGGRQGEEPPPRMRRQMELYDEIKKTLEPARQEELFKQLMRIAQEEFYLIGTAMPVGGYSVVQNNFRNVPKSLLSSTTYPSPGWSNPEQYYIEPG